MLGGSCNFEEGGPYVEGILTKVQKRWLLCFHSDHSLWPTLIYFPSTQRQGDSSKSSVHVPSLNDTLQWFLTALRINPALLPWYDMHPDLGVCLHSCLFSEVLLLTL